MVSTAGQSWLCGCPWVPWSGVWWGSDGDGESFPFLPGAFWEVKGLVYKQAEMQDTDWSSCGTGVPKWRNSMSPCDIWELSQNSCCGPEAELEGIPCEYMGPCFMSALARLLCPMLCQKIWRIISDLINLEVPPLLEGTCRLWLNLPPLSFDLLVGRVIFSRSSHPPKK